MRSWTARVSLVSAGFMLVMGLAIIPFLNRISDIEKKSQVKINEQIIIADVVSDEKDVRKGLSGRDWLGINEGMLFIFPEAGTYPFWMKGVNFPIDIIWISGDVIVGIQQHVIPQKDVPDSELRIYYPPEPVNKVLEMKAGRAQLMFLIPGDKIEVKPIIPF